VTQGGWIEPNVWEFVAGGEACERCAALEGSQWEEPPSLPHRYCNCEIIPVHPHADDPWGNMDDCGNTWSVDTLLPSEFYGPADDPAIVWAATMTVECSDGMGGEYQVQIDSGRDSAYQTPLDRAAYIWDNGYNQAEEIMSQVCECDRQLLR
jgi:hypothetical protein